MIWNLCIIIAVALVVGFVFGVPMLNHELAKFKAKYPDQNTAKLRRVTIAICAVFDIVALIASACLIGLDRMFESELFTIIVNCFIAVPVCMWIDWVFKRRFRGNKTLGSALGFVAGVAVLILGYYLLTLFGFATV